MTELAVCDALLATLIAAKGPRVWTRPPDKTPPPMCVFGQILSEPIGGKGSRAAWHIVEILDCDVGASRAPMMRMMAATRDALDGVRIVWPGLEPFVPQWLPNGGDGLDEEDGVTWIGSQRFKILGQPA